MKAHLYIRIKLADGTRQYAEPVYAANRKLKPLYAILNAKPEHHPEAVYHLRYLRAGKRVWESVGTDGQEALNRQRQREAGLNAKRAGVEILEPASAGRPLADAVVEYLDEVRRSKSESTHYLYSLNLRYLGESIIRKDPSLESLTRVDVLTFRDFLRARGNSDRSISGHLTWLRSFMTRYELKWPLLKTDRVKYTEKEVSAYTVEEIDGLLGVADQDETDLIQFLLCTGSRKQEVMFATWGDINFTLGTFKITEKLDLGFRPKDREEGLIPIPESLVSLLKARRKRYPHSRMIFELPDARSDQHLLKTIKELAYKASLNCGECHHKPMSGRKLTGCCATSATCNRFILHKFRKTFATMHHEAGVSARTIQRWLRHSSLETTLRYLAGGDDNSDRTRSLVNNTFAGVQGAESHAKAA